MITNPILIGQMIKNMPLGRRRVFIKNLWIVADNLPPLKRAEIKGLLRKSMTSLEGLAVWDPLAAPEPSMTFEYEPPALDLTDPSASSSTKKADDSGFDWNVLGKAVGNVFGAAATIYGADQQKKLAEEQIKMESQQQTINQLMTMQQQQQFYNLQQSRVDSQNRISDAQASIYQAQADLEKAKAAEAILGMQAQREAANRLLQAQTALQELSINEQAKMIQAEQEQKRLLMESGIDPDSVFKSGPSWGLYGGLAAGALALGAGGWYFLKKRKR